MLDIAIHDPQQTRAQHRQKQAPNDEDSLVCMIGDFIP